MLKILHLKHTEIDKKKWDACLDRSRNSLVYAQSWYLDIVTPGWEALIIGDYQFIMPLPVKNKWGIKYIVQPTLTQQLGVFSAENIDDIILDNFIQKIPYLSYELHLNEGNKSNLAIERVNNLLDLGAPYDTLYAAYSKNNKRNLNQAKRELLFVDTEVSFDEFIEFYDKTATHYEKINLQIIDKVFREGIRREDIFIHAARNENKSIIAAVCILQSYDRLINILPISSMEGKEKSAMFLLIDSIIKTYSNSNKTIDFEGSMIEGVARFYRGFGAQAVHYGLIKRFRPKLLIGRL